MRNCPVWAAEAAQGENSFIVIIVSKKNSAFYASERTTLLSLLKELQEYNHRVIKIAEYYFDNEQERLYCETRIGINEEELPCVAIATFSDNKTGKAIYKNSWVTSAHPCYARLVVEMKKHAPWLVEKPYRTEAPSVPERKPPPPQEEKGTINVTTSPQSAHV